MNGAHRGYGIQRGDEMHLRRAGVGEADLDAGIDQRTDQGLGTVGHEADLRAIRRIGKQRG